MRERWPTFLVAVFFAAAVYLAVEELTDTPTGIRRAERGVVAPRRHRAPPRRPGLR
jgi:hypothetical protein